MVKVVKVIRLVSLDDMLSENLWFSSPISSYKLRKVEMSHLRSNALTENGKKSSILLCAESAIWL